MPHSLYKRGFDDDTGVLKSRLAETTLLLEVLINVNSILGKSHDFKYFCIEVGKILQEKLNFKHLHIWIKDEQDKNLLRLVTPETSDGFRTMPITRGLIGKAIREVRTIYVADVTTDSDYVNVYGETKSELCVPLVYEGDAIGALNIETDTYQSFTGQIQIIEIIAENLSRAIKLAMLRQTEQYFHHLVEHMSEGVVVADNQDIAKYTNPALQRMLGYSEQEMRNKKLLDFTDAASHQTVSKELEKRKQGLEGHYEIILSAENGEKIPCFVHGVPFGMGGTMATITDLRPLKIAQKRLMKAERYLASILQHCAEAIISFDENGVIQSWNTGAEQMFGYRADEVIGNMTQIIIPEDRIASGEFEQIIHETKTKGFIREFETTRLHKNGKPINISLTMNAIKDEKGHIAGISALYRDITTQKKWERELQDRFEKTQDAYREMGKQRRHLDYLNDIINMTATASITPKQIATFIVNALVMITRVDAATLRLIDNTNTKLILTAQSGLGEEWWSKKAISYSGSLIESAVQQKHPLKILDILSEPRYTSRALARKNHLRSALIIPLETKGEVLGCITLYLSQEGNLNLLDDEFISTFTKQAAIALKLAS